MLPSSFKFILNSNAFSRNYFVVVFEVYNTTAFSEDEEIRANATSKATVAVFAASEGRPQPRVVELPKTDEGLGFNLTGGLEQNSPIYVSRIIPGGIADRLGGLYHFI